MRAEDKDSKILALQAELEALRLQLRTLTCIGTDVVSSASLSAKEGMVDLGLEYCNVISIYLDKFVARHYTPGTKVSLYIKSEE